jgi:hypothetical protein
MAAAAAAVLLPKEHQSTLWNYDEIVRGFNAARARLDDEWLYFSKTRRCIGCCSQARVHDVRIKSLIGLLRLQANVERRTKNLCI